MRFSCLVVSVLVVIGMVAGIPLKSWAEPSAQTNPSPLKGLKLVQTMRQVLEAIAPPQGLSASSAIPFRIEILRNWGPPSAWVRRHELGRPARIQLNFTMLRLLSDKAKVRAVLAHEMAHPYYLSDRRFEHLHSKVHEAFADEHAFQSALMAGDDPSALAEVLDDIHESMSFKGFQKAPEWFPINMSPVYSEFGMLSPPVSTVQSFFGSHPDADLRVNALRLANVVDSVRRPTGVEDARDLWPEHEAYFLSEAISESGSAFEKYLLDLRRKPYSDRIQSLFEIVAAHEQFFAPSGKKSDGVVFQFSTPPKILEPEFFTHSIFRELENLQYEMAMAQISIAPSDIRRALKLSDYLIHQTDHETAGKDEALQREEKSSGPKRPVSELALSSFYLLSHKNPHLSFSSLNGLPRSGYQAMHGKAILRDWWSNDLEASVYEMVSNREFFHALNEKAAGLLVGREGSLDVSNRIRAIHSPSLLKLFQSADSMPALGSQILFSRTLRPALETINEVVSILQAHPRWKAGPHEERISPRESLFLPFMRRGTPSFGKALAFTSMSYELPDLETNPSWISYLAQQAPQLSNVNAPGWQNELTDEAHLEKRAKNSFRQMKRWDRWEALRISSVRDLMNPSLRIRYSTKSSFIRNMARDLGILRLADDDMQGRISEFIRSQNTLASDLYEGLTAFWANLRYSNSPSQLQAFLQTDEGQALDRLRHFTFKASMFAAERGELSGEDSDELESEFDELESEFDGRELSAGQQVLSRSSAESLSEASFGLESLGRQIDNHEHYIENQSYWLLIDAIDFAAKALPLNENESAIAERLSAQSWEFFVKKYVSARREAHNLSGILGLHRDRVEELQRQIVQSQRPTDGPNTRMIRLLDAVALEPTSPVSDAYFKEALEIAGTNLRLASLFSEAIQVRALVPSIHQFSRLVDTLLESISRNIVEAKTSVARRKAMEDAVENMRIVMSHSPFRFVVNRKIEALMAKVHPSEQEAKQLVSLKTQGSFASREAVLETLSQERGRSNDTLATLNAIAVLFKEISLEDAHQFRQFLLGRSSTSEADQTLDRIAWALSSYVVSGMRAVESIVPASYSVILAEVQAALGSVTGQELGLQVKEKIKEKLAGLSHDFSYLSSDLQTVFAAALLTQPTLEGRLVDSKTYQEDAISDFFLSTNGSGLSSHLQILSEEFLASFNSYERALLIAQADLENQGLERASTSETEKEMLRADRVARLIGGLGPLGWKLLQFLARVPQISSAFRERFKQAEDEADTPSYATLYDWLKPHLNEAEKKDLVHIFGVKAGSVKVTVFVLFRDSQGRETRKVFSMKRPYSHNLLDRVHGKTRRALEAADRRSPDGFFRPYLGVPDEAKAMTEAELEFNEQNGEWARRQRAEARYSQVGRESRVRVLPAERYSKVEGAVVDEVIVAPYFDGARIDQIEDRGERDTAIDALLRAEIRLFLESVGNETVEIDTDRQLGNILQNSDTVGHIDFGQYSSFQISHRDFFARFVFALMNDLSQGDRVDGVRVLSRTERFLTQALGDFSDERGELLQILKQPQGQNITEELLVGLLQLRSTLSPLDSELASSVFRLMKWFETMLHIASKHRKGPSVLSAILEWEIRARLSIPQKMALALASDKAEAALAQVFSRPQRVGLSCLQAVKATVTFLRSSPANH